MQFQSFKAVDSNSFAPSRYQDGVKTQNTNSFIEFSFSLTSSSWKPSLKTTRFRRVEFHFRPKYEVEIEPRTDVKSVVSARV